MQRIRSVDASEFSTFQKLVQNIPERSWAEYTKRQETFSVHSDTQTIPLIWEDHTRRQVFEDDLVWAHEYLTTVVSHLQHHFGLKTPYVYKAMLARLPPGCTIDPHVDQDFLLQRVHRIHLPVVTSVDVHFHVGSQQYNLEPGVLYELDNTQEHSVQNQSTTLHRVHLIVDVQEPGVHPLRFAHISKTGGIAIGSIDRSLKWGIYDPFFRVIKSQRGQFHTPPHVVPGYTALAEIAQFFTVVRHPYDRIVSEYYCRVQGVHNGREDVGSFNRYIQKALSSTRLLHYIPQSRYTHDAQGVQIIPHIVRFSHLVTDVNALLESFGYPDHIRMSTKRVNQSPCFKRFGPSDFTPETRALIDTYYTDDFRLLSTFFEPM